MKLAPVVQVFNERSTILQAINEVIQFKIEKEITVINNHSTDSTREILKNLKDDSLQIIFRPKNFGSGGTVQTGAKWSIS